MEAVIRPVAYIRSDFSEKFGIPRQSGLVDALTARIVFEPEFRRPEAIRDIEGFSHLWLIWQFSQALTSEFHPTVRPPRLGGNRRVGVFASRAPYRPNGLGLSCVRLLGVERDTPDAPALLVLINRDADAQDFRLPPGVWQQLCDSAGESPFAPLACQDSCTLAARSVKLFAQ